MGDMDSGEQSEVAKGTVDSGNGKKKAADEEEFQAGFLQLFHGADSVDWMLMTLGTVGAVLSGVSMPILFLILRGLLDAFQMHGLHSADVQEEASQNSIRLIYLGILSFGGSWAAVASFNYSAQRQAGVLRQQYLAAILKQDVGFFDNNVRTGQLVLNITNDITKIQEAVGDKLALFNASLATFFSGIIIGFIEKWQVASLTVAVMFLIVLVQFSLMTATSKIAQKSEKWNEEAGTIAQQSIAQVRTVYSYAGEKRTLEAYSNALEQALKPSYISGSLKGLSLGFVWLSILVSWAMLFWYGGILITRGQATGGEVATAVFSIIISGVVVGRLIISLSTINAGRAAAYRILSVIQNEPTVNDKNSGQQTLPSVNGELSFRDVCFSYPSRPEVPILRDLSLSIQAGTTFSIVGSSGSGKSTIIALIERFYNPTSGIILLDGHDITALELQWLRGKIGLVGQEPVLFDATIKENILYGREGATDEEIEEVAKFANAHSFIRELPQGFETEVGERGVQLSGGQKQRVAIARALLRRPAILLLDEATSALDSAAEHAVQEALDKAKVGRTTIVIAHRLSTIQNADCIAVIQNGQVVELGSHSELIAKEGGHYSDLLRLKESTPSFQPQTSFRRDSMLESTPRHSSRRLAVSPSFESSPSLTAFVVGDDSPRMNTEKPGGAFGVGGGSPQLNPQKPATEMTTVRPVVESLFRLCRPEWVQAFLGALFSVISGFAVPLVAYYLGDILAAFYEANHKDMRKTIANIALIYIGIGVVYPIVSWLQYYFLEFMAARLLKRVREMMLTAMLRNEVGWFDRDENSSHRLTARIAIDAANVKAATSDRISVLLQNSSILVTTFILSFSAEWKLSLVVFATLPFFVLNAVLDAMFFRGFVGDIAKSHERAATIVGEAVGSIRTVAAFGAENKLLQLLKFELERTKAKALRRAISFGLAYGASQFFHYASYAMGMWYAVHLAYTGEATAQAVLKAFFTIQVSSYSISDTITMAPDFVRGGQAVRSMSEVLDRETEIDPDSKDGTVLEKAVGRVELREVTFRYPSRPEIVVLRNLSLQISPGTTLALVGPSGCGKSSIIALIERFYDPQIGEVLIDGVSIRKYNLRSLRQQIALVQQEPSLFATTIYQNILYGKEGATEAEVVEAATTANAHNFISALPNGYQTHVGERGVQLSGGQKQRVAIARAVLKNPAILLLDEATSALDAESEKVVQDALDRLMRNRSTLLIAHRLSTVTSADQIAVLVDGIIKEQGTHQELVSEPDSAFNRLTHRAVSHPQ